MSRMVKVENLNNEELEVFIDTKNHIDVVKSNMDTLSKYILQALFHNNMVVCEDCRRFIFDDYVKRSCSHDESKLYEDEFEYFAKYTPKLKTSTYMSEEYKQFLKEMQVGLNYHYQRNSHHPEHHNGKLELMSLLDIMEMICDWFAASKRHADGNIIVSIDTNKTRFGYDDYYADVLKNTMSLAFGVQCKTSHTISLVDVLVEYFKTQQHLIPFKHLV